MYTILSDLDGTLLTDDNKILDEDLILLKEIIKKNNFCIISNSSYHQLLEIKNEYNLDIDLISYTSNIALIDGKIIKNEINKNIANLILNEFNESIYTAYSEKLNKCLIYNYIERLDSFYPKCEREIINKFNSNIEQLFIAIKKETKDLIINFIIDNNLSYTLLGEDKNRALFMIYDNKLKKDQIINILKKAYNNKIIGISNSYYDIDFISLSDIKIAMKNSDIKLKHSCDIITEFDNNNGGAIKEIYKIIKEK